MALSIDIAREFLERPKTLVPPYVWNERRRQDKRSSKQQREYPRPAQRLDLVASASIDGGIPQGLRFRYSVFPSRLYSATFQLECNHSVRDRTTHILYRMEWHPLRGHPNRGHPDPDLSFRVFVDGESHHHFCTDHVNDDGTIKKGDVHLARPIDPDPQDLSAALAFVCATLKITNASDLPAPTDQGLLI